VMRPGALPMFDQVLLDLFVPPVGSCVWWLMSRGWATSVQGDAVSDDTKKRQRTEFWAVLCVAYFIMISITVYGYFS